MAVMDSARRQQLMKELDHAWHDANDEHLYLNSRWQALNDAKEAFDKLGEESQAEIMRSFRISASDIDELVITLRTDMKKRERRILAALIVASIVTLIVYSSWQ